MATMKQVFFNEITLNLLWSSGQIKLFCFKTY